MNKKIDYGIDGPKIIRNRIIGGILLELIAIGVYIFLNNIYPVKVFFVSIFSVLGVVYIISSFIMILSSKKGKLKEANRVIEMLDIKGEENVLDVGCGRGLYLIRIAKKLTKGTSIGIDIWSKDLSKNNKNATRTNAKLEGVNKKVKIKTADMTQIPFKDNTFDVVISSFAINNILDKNKRRKALNEMVRVLKQDGKICIIDLRYIREYLEFFNEIGISDVKVIKAKYLYPRSKIIIVSKKQFK